MSCQLQDRLGTVVSCQLQGQDSSELSATGQDSSELSATGQAGDSSELQ